MINEKDVQFYKENGYLLVRGVYNQQEVEEMRTAVEGSSKGRHAPNRIKTMPGRAISCRLNSLRSWF